MTNIHLLFPAAIQDEFRAKARKAFPKETYDFLIGTKREDCWEVKLLWTPQDVGENSEEDAVNEPAEWIAEANAFAKAHHPDYEVLGDIHTHPYEKYENECIPSEGDWQEFLEKQEFWGMLTGICLIWKTRAGLRTKIKMFRLAPVTMRTK